MSTDDLVTIDAMMIYGGSFVQALGAAASRADAVNLQKIKMTWPDEWEKYSDLAKLKAQQKAAR